MNKLKVTMTNKMIKMILQEVGLKMPSTEASPESIGSNSKESFTISSANNPTTNRSQFAMYTFTGETT